MLYAIEAGDDKKNYLQQLNRLDFVQRSPNGKIVALFQGNDTYFKSWQDCLLKNKSENLLAFQVTLSGDDCPKKSLKVCVYFHQGRIASIEYKHKIEWPRNQSKVRLDEIDWLHYEKPEVSVISSELFI